MLQYFDTHALKILILIFIAVIWLKRFKTGLSYLLVEHMFFYFSYLFSKSDSLAFEINIRHSTQVNNGQIYNSN